MRLPTQDRYNAAVRDFNSELLERGLELESLDDECLDWCLGEKVVDLYEAAEGTSVGLAQACLLVSAIQKTRPHFKFRVGFKACDVWRVKVPAVQATTLPWELVVAMAALAASAYGELGIATVLLVAFRSLLRASEALSLRRSDVFDCSNHFVFRLGVAKRGMEQKAVLTDPLAMQYLRAYLVRAKISLGVGDDVKLFDITYSRLQRWMQKLAALLGAEGRFTTHGLRRGGATDLLAHGTPIPTIAILGRWLSDRSLREYLRLGELSLLRQRQMGSADLQSRVALLNRGAASALQVLADNQGCGAETARA